MVGFYVVGFALLVTLTILTSEAWPFGLAVVVLGLGLYLWRNGRFSRLLDWFNHPDRRGLRNGAFHVAFWGFGLWLFTAPLPTRQFAMLFAGWCYVAYRRMEIHRRQR